jgi:hypothetical protein
MTGDKDNGDGGAKGDLRVMAAAQGGVLLTCQATSRGWDENGLRYRLRKDGWTRIHRGAWAEPGRAVDLGLRLLAVQTARPGVVASHTSAAALHGIELLDAPAVEFTSQDLGRRFLLHGGVLHRIPFGEADVVQFARLRVTTVCRAAVDLLCAASRDMALLAVESALSERPVPGHPQARRPALVHLAEIAAALRAAPGRRGQARASRHLAFADARSGSPAETIARLRMHDAGLYPELQARLTTADGRRLRPDFLFRAEGLAVEIEGYRWHGTRQAHTEDVRRFNALGGCREIRRILRFTAADVFHRPEWMIASVRSALAGLVSGEKRAR